MTLQYQHLRGREFLHGVRDCFALVRTFFSENFGIEITDYARPHDWSSDHIDLIRTLHEREGFKMVTDWTVRDLRPADVLALAINESAPNHFAIYVGDNLIVQHLYGRLSSIEPYRDFFRHATCFLLRHPDVPDLRPSLPSTDIGSLLRDRYRVQAAQ